MKSEIVYFTQLIDPIEFLIGKNEKDNFNIIDMSGPNDLWFHLSDYPSCHVIAKLPENIHKENLKYKSEKDISIIYTFIKNIKKTEKIGCVISTNTKNISI
jgi:predicted ribosome quality control (RQC) complex YloA/Tae2 family protein